MRRHLTAWVAVFVAVAGLWTPAPAVMPSRDQSGDARRFGLDNPEPFRKRPTAAALQAAARFKARGARARYSAQGQVAGLSGRLSSARAGSPAAIASSFLYENRGLLAVDPAQLQLEQSRRSGDVTHLLYQQTSRGLLVEFARVKVHVSDAGEVIGFNSGYVPGIDASAAPGVSEGQAAAAVARDLGAPVSGGGVLVYLPVYKTGEVRLAWKFTASGRHASWRYYVDAQTAEILFRYNALRYVSGTVTAQVYDLDPRTPAVSRPMANERIHVYSDGGTPASVTDASGYFSNATDGKIFASLQGPYANVAHFNLPSAHYDNGGGVWCSGAVSPAVATPHPYPNGTQNPNSVVFVATISAPTQCSGYETVKAMPVFSMFKVGSSVEDPIIGLEIVDDDQAQVVGADGIPVASYVGEKTLFKGAAVSGWHPSVSLRLTANPSGQQQGFEVIASSYLALTDNPTVPVADSSFEWTPSLSADSGYEEVNLFYQLNKMHDYFMGGVNASAAAPISEPVLAMAHAGPNLANAFYNPDQHNFFFGDMDNFSLDATVIRHEYVHFVIEKIYPVLNFGQFGAISEGLSDYFAASSLNVSKIGGGLSLFAGPEGSLRDLASSGCTDVPPAASCRIFPTQWAGEIHDDSLPFSQGLWDLRGDGSVGAACADELVFQALFFYPESFQEFLDAMIQVDARRATLAPSCGTSKQGAIVMHMGNHGISLSGAGVDAYEPNDGAQSATDVSALASISATVYPAADLDFYTFGAGPGLVHAKLSLPLKSPGSYFAYGMQLLDRSLKSVASAYPGIDVNPTPNGNCQAGGGTPETACQTTATQVDLYYDNPAAEQFYLFVSGAPNDDASNSGTNSTLPYVLRVDYQKSGALSASIVSASFDNDTLRFSVAVSSFVKFQNYAFDHAQLRDHALGALPQTATNGASPFMTLLSSSGAQGTITGELKLTPGFAARFPSMGTVHLEVFGVDLLKAAECDPTFHPGVSCAAHSLGLSPPIHLTAGSAELTAWNNVFNPAQGQKATFKYGITDSGHVSLKLYTLNGVLVSTLVDQDMPAGKGTVDWYGRNTAGSTVSSGIYLLHLVAPGIRKTQKVIVVK